jgi:hypothetical protein
MPDTGAVFTGTGASFNDGGTTAWTNPTNIQGDTTSTAATCNISAGGGTSHKLRATNFNFSVPSTAIIVGVLVEVERNAANTNRHADDNVQLIVSGTESGNDKALGTAITTTKQFVSYGGSSDLWGNTLTPAIVNSSNFGVSYKIVRTGTATTTSVYRVRITVYYQTNTYANLESMHRGMGRGMGPT